MFRNEQSLGRAFHLSFTVTFQHEWFVFIFGRSTWRLEVNSGGVYGEEYFSCVLFIYIMCLAHYLGQPGCQHTWGIWVSFFSFYIRERRNERKLEWICRRGPITYPIYVLREKRSVQAEKRAGCDVLCAGIRSTNEYLSGGREMEMGCGCLRMMTEPVIGDEVV
ncbi:hypothetical protein F5X96DRAFT_334631 [Biscogniauxia mediterranea]|nr:hypothetical protein F5X96DRAFT_334631 [Biscogniauxia mediterranea]